MNRDQFPLFAELVPCGIKDFTSESGGGKFCGTNSPRHLRVLYALMTRPRRREEIDCLAGCSNAPDLIAELRRRGLRVKCQRTPGIDRDGFAVFHGVYSLDELDRHKLAAWLREREGTKP